MSTLTEVTSGLAFPEGPIAMSDGTVILVEMFGPRLTRVHPDGTKETVAEVPGGPNGAAVGPGGLVYVCNNGARFTETQLDGMTFPGPVTKDRYIGGRIQTVDVDDWQGHGSVHGMRQADHCGRRMIWCSTPTGASTSPTTASPTTRSASPT